MDRTCFLKPIVFRAESIADRASVEIEGSFEDKVTMTSKRLSFLLKCDSVIKTARKLTNRPNARFYHDRASAEMSDGVIVW